MRSLQQPTTFERQRKIAVACATKRHDQTEKVPGSWEWRYVVGQFSPGNKLWEISAEEVQMTTGPERERTFRSAGDELGPKLWEMTKGPSVLGMPRTGVEPMAPSRSNAAIEPMTLGHMRRNGVHSLLIACQKCRHEVVMTANLWGDDVPVPAIGPRTICSKCGNIGADSRPNWQARGTD